MTESVLALSIRAQAGGYVTSARLGDDPALDVPFVFERAPNTQTHQKLEHLETGYYAIDDVKYVGAELWSALFPGRLGSRARGIVEASELTTLRLEVCSDLDELPWELLWDERLQFVAAHPKLRLVHTLPASAEDSGAPPRSAAPVSTLAILVVIPQGSGLDTATEWQNLKVSVAKLGDSISLQELRGVVSPDRLAEALKERRWHVVHFIGHGRLQENSVELRLNDDAGEESWRNADEVSALFQGARVDACVLNCCYGGTTTGVRTTDRLAPALLNAGVRSVVAMRYAMTDTAANRFSQVFYEELLRGSRAGDPGYAAQIARKSLLQNAPRDDRRCFFTPLVHASSSVERLFAPSSSPAATPPPAKGIEAEDGSIKRLADALRRRQCIPIVGEGLTSPPPLRRDSAVGGLRGLVQVARRLAATELEASVEQDSFADHWPPEAQLGRLAERFEAQKRWDCLVDAVRNYYAAIPPPEAFRLIASWQAPGLLYTHFDGLMEAAFASATPARVVRNLTESPESNATLGPHSSLLVLIRGSLSDPASVVLSEYDHFVLSERIEKMHSSITVLTKTYGRCLVFLGAAPADRVTRELARKFLVANDPRATESFFVSPSHLPGDELFWRRYRVTFIRAETESVVRGLSGALVGA